jgi:hypothetical protein
MTGAAALARLHDLGVTAEARDDRLVLRPASAVPPELLAELRGLKAEVLALLKINRATLADASARADPPQWTLADHMRHAQQLRGLRGAAMQRPPAWSDPAARPSPGCWCSSCRGRRWWREAHLAQGWRCATCHPAVHLPGGAILEMLT